MAGNPVVFDDVESFTINVHSGSVVLSPQVITDLFNNHILDYWPRPLDELTITTKDDYLEVEGDLKLWRWFPGIWLPADLGGKIVLNGDNKLVYEIDDVRVLGIPLYGLLSAIFIDLDLLLSIEREGAELVDSVLVLDHTSVFPPPALSGRIASASLDSDGLRLVFADNDSATFSKPSVAANSYIWAQSGDPRLFDIVVNNGTVQVLPEDASKPLRFNLYDYRKHVPALTVLRLILSSVVNGATVSLTLTTAALTGVIFLTTFSSQTLKPALFTHPASGSDDAGDELLDEEADAL